MPLARGLFSCQVMRRRSRRQVDDLVALACEFIVTVVARGGVRLVVQTAKSVAVILVPVVGC